jgi:hypothetical protein
MKLVKRFEYDGRLYTFHRSFVIMRVVDVRDENIEWRGPNCVMSIRSSG